MLAAKTTLLPTKIAYLQLQLDPKECADCAWLLRVEDGKSFLLFVDSKSRSVVGMEPEALSAVSSTKDVYDMSTLPGRGKQAEHFLSLVEAAQAFPDSDVVENSLLDAIRDRRVLYLYLNTDEKKETYAVGDSILHMGGAESEAFLSCFYNFYRMNRVCLPRM